jgi:hypothetical protein
VASPLPTLKELRAKAVELGLDPTPFGRSRRALWEAVEAERLRRYPKPRLVKYADSLTPPVQVDIDPATGSDH